MWRIGRDGRQNECWCLTAASSVCQSLRHRKVVVQAVQTPSGRFLVHQLPGLHATSAGCLCTPQCSTALPPHTFAPAQQCARTTAARRRCGKRDTIALALRRNEDIDRVCTIIGRSSAMRPLTAISLLTVGALTITPQDMAPFAWHLFWRASRGRSRASRGAIVRPRPRRGAVAQQRHRCINA